MTRRSGVTGAAFLVLALVLAGCGVKGAPEHPSFLTTN